MAGPPRFELGTAESKSAELPLLHRPINSVYFASLYSVFRKATYHVYFTSINILLPQSHGKDVPVVVELKNPC